MGKKKTIHILSNTHWDREWRFPFQQTRLLLIKLVDHLIDLMEKDPEYKFYNFDSQAIFLEDYLEYRPENKERLAKLISDGRIIAGPWYTLPEEFCVSGESLVRNLLMGHQVVSSFGPVSKVGYTPTSYGQISQLPQIYKSFGIDGMMFYRGISPDECTNEYFWEGADGSRILGIRLSRFVSRGAFFLYVARPTMHPKDYHGYEWGEEGCLPFHFNRAEDDHEEEPVIVRSTFGDTCNLRYVKKGVETAMDDILSQGTTDCLVMMDGMDSTAPNKNLPKILKTANKVNPNWNFIHSSLPNFLKDLKSKIKPEKMTLLKGERRHPSKDNGFNAFLKESLSSRVYIKQRNAEVENMLTKWAEPFSTIANILTGYEYQKSPLTKAWKYVLASHSHDSIGGLSPDQIHKDMMYRFDQAYLIAEGVAKEALGEIIAQVDTSDAAPEDVMVTVFNPNSGKLDDVPTLYVDFPRDKEIRAFDVFDEKEKKVLSQNLSREDSYLIATEKHDVPMNIFTTKWKVAIDAKEVPPLGYKTFKIHPREGWLSNHGSQLTSPNSMENEFLKVKIESNGSLTVTDKLSNEVYSGILGFEDSGEWGDPWTRMVPHGDIVFNTQGSSPSIKVLEDGPLLTTFSIRHKWALPEGIDFHSKTRSENLKDLYIDCKVTLKKGVPRLNVKLDVDNTIKYHRLRVLINSGFKAKTSIAQGQFDVLERPVELPDTSDWLEPMTGTNPFYGFVTVENGKRGLAVVQSGLLQYEVMDNDEGTMALTLLRAYGYPKMSGLLREDRVIREGNEGSQCLGKQNYSFGLYFYNGSWKDSQLMNQQNSQASPPITVHHSRYNGKNLKKSESFFELTPENICLTAVKKSENENGFIFRMYNPTGKSITGELKSKFKIKKAESLSLGEEKLKSFSPKDSKTVSIKIPKKKIVTIGVEFETS